MELTHIKVSNYKGLCKTESPLSNFVCVVGENNAGKSSLLQTLLLFITGTKLSKSEYYDPEQDIVITVELSGITEELLSEIPEETRLKLDPYIHEEKLALARRYSTDGSSKLRVMARVPKDEKFKQDTIKEVFAGTKGKEISSVFLQNYPEVADTDTAESLTTQTHARKLIENYIDQLSPEDLIWEDIPLPSGTDSTVRSLLPDPVYIPAVKDLSDDLKTKESASFGKLLKILLNVIEEDLTEAFETFENLRRKLNRVTEEDGTQVDNRMGKVREIEQTIQRNLQQTFRDVSIELEIPPPEIKTVLSNATIVADDGVRGPVENKGDGFKRAMTFSILRSYVQLSQSAEWQSEPNQNNLGQEKFLFLFEEPELYLHPHAQNILFDALALIAKRHQMVVTTHSPLFFSADETTTFVKITKQCNNEYPRPIGVCSPVDLTDITEKDRFQIISFETSNFAFFSDKIILVEGDSELIVLPHIAKLLNNQWDFKTASVNLVKVNGKGSFKRYKEFFERFSVKVFLVTDLDILIQGFDKIDPSPEAEQLRSELLQEVDRLIDEANSLPDPPARLLRRELQRERANQIYAEIKEARSNGDVERQTNALEEFFIFERTNPRLEILSDHSQESILAKKQDLFAELLKSGVFVLEKGAIESYYPSTVRGSDKPSKAQSFCTIVKTGDEVRELCELIEVENEQIPELEAIFRKIFGVA